MSQTILDCTHHPPIVRGASGLGGKRVQIDLVLTESKTIQCKKPKPKLRVGYPVWVAYDEQIEYSVDTEHSPDYIEIHGRLRSEKKYLGRWEAE